LIATAIVLGRNRRRWQLVTKWQALGRRLFFDRQFNGVNRRKSSRLRAYGRTRSELGSFLNERFCGSRRVGRMSWRLLVSRR
jgi:hypothetical protein